MTSTQSLTEREQEGLDHMRKAQELGTTLKEYASRFDPRRIRWSALGTSCVSAIGSRPRRSALKQLLIDSDGTACRGKLLTDGVERYDAICAELKLLHFGCMQHTRAHFYKARKVSQLPSSRTPANAAIDGHIRQIFVVESEIDKLRSEYEKRGQTLPLEVVHTLRQEKAKPLLEKFKTWVDELLPGSRPLLEGSMSWSIWKNC